jgi:hypothetical protein
MNKLQNFNIQIHCLVIGTDVKNSKQYILSTNDDEIILPCFLLDNQSKLDLEQSVISYLKNYVVCNELELMPQITSFHDESIPKGKKKNMINTVYSSVINKESQIHNAYWIEFDFLEPMNYSNLIFEAIQKLK